MGLASAYGIVKMHHGVIDVESIVGEGTTFIVYLPVKKGEYVQKSVQKEEIIHGSSSIAMVL